MHILKKILKIKLVQYYETKTKNMYGSRIEMAKYLLLFYQNHQNKSWLNFNTASKVCKFSGLVSTHSVFDAILLKLQLTPVLTLNGCYMEFEKNFPVLVEEIQVPQKVLL